MGFSRIGLGIAASVLALAAMAAVGEGARAQSPSLQPEQRKVTLGVGGKALLYYLPLTIAERKGFFKEQGLDVEINDFAGGAKSLQALIGGSVDVVAGAYEHTLRMQAKGQDIVAVIEMGRFPGIVVGVKTSAKWQNPGDFKGMKIGVTAPGSSTNMMMSFVLAKAGLSSRDVAFVGVGSAATAVAAVQKGEIDAISHLDPVISMLERTGDIRVIIDTRTEEGTRAVFGGANPAAVLYMKRDFLEKNPKTTQALVNALYKALRWIETASPEDVAAAVPVEYTLGDKGLYEMAVAKSKPAYSRTGIPEVSAMRSALDMLERFDPEMKDAKADVMATFDPRFAKTAAETAR